MALTPPLDLLSPAWTHLSRAVIVRGQGPYLYAEDGRTFLDFTCGIGVTNTGHCHPCVVRAIQEQAEKLLFAQMNCTIPQQAVELAAALRPLLPEKLDCLFFSNSGAEAVEGAVKLARAATGRTNIVAFQGGFHGRTSMGMALTTSKTVYRVGFQPLPSGIFFAPYPYAYYYGWDEECTVAFCLRELETLLHGQTDPRETAALIVEPVLGEGGYVPAPPAFLRGLRQLCDQHQILLIFDEIQSGFGRTGRWWSHQHSGVEPDLMVLAKGIASGLPMSAIAAPRSLMEKWVPGSHGGTYGGGSAVVLAAAIATIQTIQEEGLVDNAARQGQYLLDGLRRVQKDHPFIGDVRGLGLMLATEFTVEGKPAADLARKVSAACEAAGLLLLTCGTYGNVLRWIPPLIVEPKHIDQALAIFRKVLKDAG